MVETNAVVVRELF